MTKDTQVTPENIELNSQNYLTLSSLSRPLRQQAGMTLVEIMIVLAIIGAIVALLTNTVGGALDKSKVREAKIQMGQITQALNMYYTDCGALPKSLEGLAKPDADCKNWGPEAYYKKKLKDPWNNDFIYEATSSGGFNLKSLGKGGKEGGTGYEADILADESEENNSKE